MIDLIKNDGDCFDLLVEISRLLSNNNVELRRLNDLKKILINQENGNIIAASLDSIEAEVKKIIGNCEDKEVINAKFMKYFKPVGDEVTANFEKVNNLVEFL